MASHVFDTLTITGGFTTAFSYRQLVAGTNITFTPAAGTPDTLTIAATGVGTVSDGDYGDITVSSSGTVWTIDNDVVTFAKMQNIATDKVLGRTSAGTGDIQEVTFTDQAQQLCDDTSFAAMATTLGLGTGDSPQFTAINLGHATDTTITRVSAGVIAVEGVTVPMPGGTNNWTAVNTFTNTGFHILDIDGNFDLIISPGSNLTADRTLVIFTGDTDRALNITGDATISGTNTGDQTITLTGDVTGSGTGSFAATIANDAVTYAKIQNVSATDKLLGRSTAGAGDVEEIPCTSFARSILDDANEATFKATVNLEIGTDVQAWDTLLDSVAALSDPNADRILFWDDSAGAMQWLTIGTGLSITTTTISATGSGGTVTSVSVVTANGVSGSVATATTTPAITLTLGDITPTLVTCSGYGFFTVTNADTNTYAIAMYLSHNSSGTPAAGFGTAISWRAETTTTADTLLGEQIATWVDATHASRKARFVWTVYDTAEREYLRGEASGTAAKIGFLGTAAAVQQTGDVGTALVTFGLMSGTPTFAAANLSGTIATAQIANDAVTYAKIQNISAASRLLGRGSAAGAGDVEELTIGSGLSLSGTALSATALSDGDKGDITVSASGATWTIDNDVVTYAKMQNVSATDKLLGRSTAGAGDVEEIACTAAGRAILDDANAAAQRTTLGLGTSAVIDTGTSGTKVALTDGANQWSATQRFINSSGITILDTGADHTLGLIVGENLSANRTLTVVVNNANRTLTIGADSSISGTAYVSGGTDVAIADGGTGASDAATAFANIKQAASDTATGVIEIAVQSEMETGTDTTRAVVPGRQHYHPSATKGWVNFTGTGTVTINASYNVTSITDNGTGDYTVNWTTAFSSANYCVGATSSFVAGSDLFVETHTSYTTGTARVYVVKFGVGLTDPTLVNVWAWGDQ